MRKLRTKAALVSLLTACGATSLVAHDFWLVPNAFAVTPGQRVMIRGQTSSLFPTSLSAVTPDRVADARVVTADTMLRIDDLAASGSSLLLSRRLPRAGQHVVGVRLAPRNVRESPESFRRYLTLEGAPEALERYSRLGLLPAAGSDSITRRYAKYAKTFVEVGRGPRAFLRVLNHPLEFSPLSDPASLRAGDSLRVRLLLFGKPLADARLHAGVFDARSFSVQDTSAARSAARADVLLETDSAGVATVVLRAAGLWNVRTLQIVPAERASGADWDVHWATVVFSVAPR